MPYYVYILTNKRNGTLYVGVTNDIVRRTWEHREGLNDSFTKRYDTNKLVYVEPHEDIGQAIACEKNLKRWRRTWKIDLIEKENPDWRNLYDELNG
jgi:putative endonuclease